MTPQTAWPFFLPTNAASLSDLQKSWCLLQPLRTLGVCPGLMLVIRDGMRGLAGEAAERQRAHLKTISDQYGDAPIVVMLSNVPIAEMDWLHHPSNAAEHVRAGIRFAASLPVDTTRFVTFHLNALCAPDEFQSAEKAEWQKKFFDIAPLLQTLVTEAAAHHVRLFIETVPDPEFGDIPLSDERTYRDVKLRHLQNPWILSSAWGFKEIHDLGLGIVLDLSHHRTLMKKTGDGMLKDELRHLNSSDLIHLNDGRGEWSPDGVCFEEGVPLGEGDIVTLPELIRMIRERRIPAVLEVNDVDINERAETVRSLAYLAKHLG